MPSDTRVNQGTGLLLIGGNLPQPSSSSRSDPVPITPLDEADLGWKYEIEVRVAGKSSGSVGPSEYDDLALDSLDEPLSPLHEDLYHTQFPQAPPKYFDQLSRGPRKDYGYNFGTAPAGKKRRALLIGIRGNGTRHLLGCHNDVEDVRRLLTSVHGFEEREIMVLKDDDPQSFSYPTRDVILDHLELLVENAMEGDRLFLHFSGHGGQIPDLDFDEADGLDEVIYCADSKYIVDDELHDIVVKPLPKGCHLTALFDCCASGTGLDLVRTPHLTTAALTPSNGVLDLPHTYESVLNPPTYGPTSTQSISAEFPVRGRKKHSSGDVIMWSACLDSGDSHEVVTSSGQHKGAMSQAFVQCLEKMPKQSYQHLLEAITMVFKQWGVPQQPQLSTSQKINRQELFTI